MMLLRTSLLGRVRHPALWRRIDVTSNRPRHPAYTKAKKDQQEGLCILAALDHQYKEEHNRPGDGKASTVDPIVSISRHHMHLFLSYHPCARKDLTNESSRQGRSHQYHVLSVYLIITIIRQIPRLPQISPLSRLPQVIVDNLQDEEQYLHC